MDITIVSIDFSILYPGICICKNFKDFKWIALVNTKIKKADFINFNNLMKKYPNIKISFLENKRKKTNEYHINERIKLENYLNLINTLINQIKNELENSINLIVVLEGISFGSKGNSLIDISQSTGILKSYLAKEIVSNNLERIFIFSPSELKNSIGCKGNANKLEIFKKFKSDPILQSVKKSDLYKLVNNEKWILENNKVKSPIIDMIDSYLGVMKIYQILKNNNM